MAYGTVSVVDTNNYFVMVTPDQGGGDVTLDRQILQGAGITIDDLKKDDRVSFDLVSGSVRNLRRV
ncbi:Cold shock protein, CspA family [Pseudomonas cedrina]|uniref:CSD domain-containing protein n=2 Tax=Pseudomonas cedrina TaxID=651740 RepID=A0A1V2K3F8_PSECE|nr:hypothetical protein [Pseudomonas cedrina]ONH52228.1 hypothetical protein BLL36_19290 [Pseudomonas cedrina subsp. cedrina]SDT21507.1 Cold shock protein, CspA family [Pseudomonas cedrina]